MGLTHSSGSIVPLPPPMDLRSMIVLITQLKSSNCQYEYQCIRSSIGLSSVMEVPVINIRAEVIQRQAYMHSANDINYSLST